MNTHKRKTLRTKLFMYIYILRFRCQSLIQLAEEQEVEKINLSRQKISIIESIENHMILFSWDTVKSDKDRECYLGHSVMAPTGRWQEGKDINW